MAMQNRLPGAGEMAQWLRALAALAEGPYHPQRGSQSPITTVPRDPTPGL